MSRCRCRGARAEEFPGDDAAGVDNLLKLSSAEAGQGIDAGGQCRAKMCLRVDVRGA